MKTCISGRPARGGRRACFRWAWRRLSSSRARLAARDGRVGRRGGSTRSPSASFPRSRSRASSRFRDCDRVSEAVARTTGPSRSSSRARWRGPSDGESSTRNDTSTRVSDRLACWPPGPPEVVVRHSSSSLAIAQLGVTRRNPSFTP